MSNKNFDLIIFDFDGTSFETHLSVYFSLKMTFEFYQLEVPSDEYIDKVIGTGVGLPETFEGLFKLMDIKTENVDFENYVVKYREIYNKTGYKYSTPYSNYTDLIRKFKNENVKLVIASNKGIQSIENALIEFKIQDCFDLVIGSTKDLKVIPKPDPMIYQELILPIFPLISKDRILVVGDTIADINFAKNIGVNVAWAKYGYGDLSLKDDLQDNFILENISELESIVLSN